MDRMPDGRPVEYVGDGVYAIYEPWAITLHANHHLAPSDVVVLENSVLKSLIAFKERCDNGNATE